MSLDAGMLRHRISIEALSSGQDNTTGEMVETWSTVTGMSSVPASIEPLSARDFIAARTEQTEITARITFRYRAGIPAVFRIVHRGDVYVPAGILPDKESGQEYVTVPVRKGVKTS